VTRAQIPITSADLREGAGGLVSGEDDLVICEVQPYLSDPEWSN
jgi:hypothetical protein